MQPDVSRFVDGAPHRLHAHVHHRLANNPQKRRDIAGLAKNDGRWYEPSPIDYAPVLARARRRRAATRRGHPFELRTDLPQTTQTIEAAALNSPDHGRHNNVHGFDWARPVQQPDTKQDDFSCPANVTNEPRAAAT